MNDEIKLYAIYDKGSRNKRYEKISFYLCYQDIINDGEIILGQYEIDSNDTLKIDFRGNYDYRYRVVIFELMKHYGLAEMLKKEVNLEMAKNVIRVDSGWDNSLNYIETNNIDLLIVNSLERPNIKVVKQNN